MPTHAKLRPSTTGRWWVEPLSEEARTLVDGRRAVCGILTPLHHGAILRLGAACELRVDLPDWSGAPARSLCSTPSSGASSAAVLERSFVAAESSEQLAPPLTGSERARELNFALRRALCQTTGRERAETRDREVRYEDQAAKRRRLHPIEWQETDSRELQRQEELPELHYMAETYRQETASSLRSDGSFAGGIGSGTGDCAGVGYVG
ncbi:unnamed protein product, partial [Polarella glacialis]